MAIVRWWALVLAGVFGAAGVAAAAASSHGPASAPLGSMALICLAHAPVLLVLALAAPSGRRFDLAAGALGFGTLAFSADMAFRAIAGGGLLPLLAPLGGLVLIAGWVWLICIGLMALPSRGN